MDHHLLLYRLWVYHNQQYRTLYLNCWHTNLHRLLNMWPLSIHYYCCHYYCCYWVRFRTIFESSLVHYRISKMTWQTRNIYSTNHITNITFWFLLRLYVNELISPIFWWLMSYLRHLMVGTETKNVDNWITANHDIHGTIISYQITVNAHHKDLE